MGFNYLASLSHYVPELLTCFTMFILILLEATFKTGEKRNSIFYYVVFLALAFIGLSLFKSLGHENLKIFTGSMIIDFFSSFIKLIMVLATAISIYLSIVSKEISEDTKGEFSILVVGVLVGGMILVSANNMLMLYIGVETLSILAYALASLKKNDNSSAEAGLKYSLYGAFSSGIMLFGLSILFGVYGSINFSEIAVKSSHLSINEVSLVMPAFLMLLAGLGYKIACVPFHMWSPDVYEGSPTPVTAFFAIVPKFAGIAAIARLTYSIFANTSSTLSIGWVGVLSVIAVLTMTVGNITAINQRSFKRMLAFSSISHAGVILLGIVVVDIVGLNAILFYSVAYVFMNMLAFFVVCIVENQTGNDHFERFSGMIYKYPVIAIALTIAMFSFAGLPPFAGFIAKFNILNALVVKKLYTIAIILVINSVISVYYYFKVIRFMIFKPVESEEAISGFNFLNQGFVILLTFPIVFLGIFWSRILTFVQHSSILFK